MMNLTSKLYLIKNFIKKIYRWFIAEMNLTFAKGKDQYVDQIWLCKEFAHLLEFKTKKDMRKYFKYYKDIWGNRKGYQMFNYVNAWEESKGEYEYQDVLTNEMVGKKFLCVAKRLRDKYEVKSFMNKKYSEEEINNMANNIWKNYKGDFERLKHD